MRQPSADVRVDFQQVLTCHVTAWHRVASTFLSAAMAVIQQMDKAIDKVERDPVGLVWKTLNIASEYLTHYDTAIRFYSETSSIKQIKDDIQAMIERKEIGQLSRKKIKRAR